MRDTIPGGRSLRRLLLKHNTLLGRVLEVILNVGILAGFCALAGCGGGSGGSASQQPPPPPPEVTSVTVSPGTANLYTGNTQLFTVQVTGTGAFDASVTWSVDNIIGGNSTLGTINAGQYSAPATAPSPNFVTITAISVQNSYAAGNAMATVYSPAVLTSITPDTASAGQPVTISGQNLDGATAAFFSGANGTSISTLGVTQISPTAITTTVPFGATSGPVSLNLAPYQGANETTNSVAFTRLPNLRVHAAEKDLSSGEMLQLDWRLLGASTPSTVTWTADSGSVSAQGVFQAPIVSSESYSRVTGCTQGNNSCNTVLLRILPFRIGPPNAVVDVGNTIQMDAIQGESTLAPPWSVLAGGGSITSGGLFTAPTTAAQAGPVTIGATSGSTTEQTSVAVSGAFPGLVNRIYDYADYTTFTPPEATFVKSVAVSGNRAYALTIGAAFQFIPGYEALDVYDISNPDQPVWIDAGETASNAPADLFAYGNTLISFDPADLIVYSLTSQVPEVTAVVPVARPFQWTMNNGVLYVLPYLTPDIILPTMPIDLYDVSTGTLVHTHYELPNPSSGSLGVLQSITGNGNIVYVSAFSEINNTPTFTIATYDVSQSPPALLSTVVSNSSTEYNLQIVGSLLFADSQIYDISNVSPVAITTLSLPIQTVWGVQGNNVLARAGSQINGSGGFAVVNVGSPANPVVQANVPDLLNWDIFAPGLATWAPNGRFYATDGMGGFGVYNVATRGGPASVTTALDFIYIYDQVLEQQTLYTSALYGSGAGGLACFDVSGSTPNLLGTLMYPNDSSFALQVSGTTVFLGLADSLKVVNASNPQSPAEIGSVSVPVNALLLSGNTLFVGTGDGRLVVFDVSTPASPTQIASVPMPAPSTMRLSGTLLLVAAGQSGLLLFDVSQPKTPALLSQFSPTVSAPVWDVISVGPSAVMLAADSSGVVTVDISNPSQPRQLYQQPLPYLSAFPMLSLSQAGIIPAFSLASQNGLTYLGSSAGILFAFDATVPAIPRLVAIDLVGYSDLDVVAVITPGAGSLYLADQGAITKLENSVPQNSIELYYPPAALSLAYPLTDSARQSTTRGNPKLEWMSRRPTKNAQTPSDRTTRCRSPQKSLNIEICDARSGKVCSCSGASSD